MRYSGSGLPTPKQSTGRSALVVFTTDGNKELSGFTAFYSVVAKRVCPDGYGGSNCDMVVPPLVIADAGYGVESLTSNGALEPTHIPTDYVIGVAFKTTNPQAVIFSETTQGAGTQRTGRIRACDYPPTGACRVLYTASDASVILAGVAFDIQTVCLLFFLENRGIHTDTNCRKWYTAQMRGGGEFSKST